MQCEALKSTSMASADLLGRVPELPQDREGPIFNAPWEAQAFALTLALYEKGFFTWQEWADSLTQAIRDAQAVGDPDTGATYYHHWLVALERMTERKGLLNAPALVERTEAWRRAAARTPHGQPITLKNAE